MTNLLLVNVFTYLKPGHRPECLKWQQSQRQSWQWGSVHENRYSRPVEPLHRSQTSGGRIRKQVDTGTDKPPTHFLCSVPTTTELFMITIIYVCLSWFNQIEWNNRGFVKLLRMFFLADHTSQEVTVDFLGIEGVAFTFTGLSLNVYSDETDSLSLEKHHHQ